MAVTLLHMPSVTALADGTDGRDRSQPHPQINNANDILLHILSVQTLAQD